MMTVIYLFFSYFFKLRLIIYVEKAFTQKKLKITGNMSIAMKLNQIFASIAKPKSKL